MANSNRVEATTLPTMYEKKTPLKKRLKKMYKKKKA